MISKFNDPMETMFKDKFGLDTFDYVQKLIAKIGYSSKEAYEDLQVQMDIIWNDFKQNNRVDWVTVKNIEDNPFIGTVRSTAELHGFGSPSVKSAVG